MLDAEKGSDHIQALQALFGAALRRAYGPRQVLIREGDRPTSLYLLSQGTATVSLTDWHGHHAVLSLLGPGEFFGEMGMLPGGEGHRSAQVTSRSEVVLLEIPYPRFIALCRDHPLLWLELAGQLAQRLRTTNRRLVGQRVLKLHERLWYVLSELAARPDAEPVEDGHAVRITRDELGMLIGCTRETAGLALAEMAEEGRIRLLGRRIVVPAQSCSTESPPPPRMSEA
ncbi:MAG TPA: cyclic nucleotide-binding domain-containing protein [Nevskiaceae bacterium]|nr:cyclic nucleotide-binding domain-containing protein [Nevskiaceae bacterium]